MLKSTEQAGAQDKNLLDEIQKLKGENERLKNELQSLKVEPETLKSSDQAGAQDNNLLDNLLDELQKLNGENERLKNELEALRAELGTLKLTGQTGAQDQNLLDEIQKLKGENERLQNTIAEQTEKMKKLESGVKDLGDKPTGEEKDLGKEITALSVQLKQLQAEKEKLENELKDYLEKNKILEDKIKSYESGDDPMKVLKNELEALKSENNKLKGSRTTDDKLRQEIEADCEAKLAALKGEHQKELERRDQVHRENLETCQIELIELKGKLQDSDQTFQLKMDKDKNKDEYMKEYEDEISRLQKQKDKLTKNFKADLDTKNAELDTLRFEKNKEVSELKKQLTKCLGDCEKYQIEIKLLKEKLKGLSSENEKLVDRAISEPVITEKVEARGKEHKEDKYREEKKTKKSTPKHDNLPVSKTEIDDSKISKMAEVSPRMREADSVPSKVVSRVKKTSKPKPEDKPPEGPKMVQTDGGVCRCMDHPMVKIIYKILHGEPEVLTTEEKKYLHEKLCWHCRSTLHRPKNEAQLRAHRKNLQQEIKEREEKMFKGVAVLEEHVHEGKQDIERLYKHLTEKKQKANMNGQMKMAFTYQQKCSVCVLSAARRTASGTAIGSKTQQTRNIFSKAVDPIVTPRMTIICPGCV